MAVYKDKNGTWYVSARYDNWQGEHARKVKRGFKKKKTLWNGNATSCLKKPEVWICPLRRLLSFTKQT